MSELDRLRTTFAHTFKERGANGNLPPARCLFCGLLRGEGVHDAAAVQAQVNKGDSFMAGVVAKWEGPGK